MKIRHLLSPMAFIAAALLIALSATAAPLGLGAPLPAFSLKNVDGQAVSSADYGARRALVVIFTTNHCMYSRAYQKRLMELQNTYGSQGVQLVLINPSDGAEAEETAEAMQKRAAEQHFPFPYLADPTQQTAKAFGALRTPEAFLFGPDHKLVYHGRIDDNTEESMVRAPDLRNALDFTLAGTPQKIAHSGTDAFGCSIKWKP
jgi:peroxiredoxin